MNLTELNQRIVYLEDRVRELELKLEVLIEELEDEE
jgi:hypothetical protein